MEASEVYLGVREMGMEAILFRGKVVKNVTEGMKRCAAESSKVTQSSHLAYWKPLE